MRTRARGNRRSPIIALICVLALAGCLSSMPHDEHDSDGDSTPAALIWAEPFPTLLIEVDYVEGREPSRLALDVLLATLTEVTDKREVIIQTPTALPREDPRFSGPRDWSAAELFALRKEFFDAGHPAELGRDGVAFLHVMYLNGRFVDDEVSGVGAQIGPAVYVFLDRARDLSVGHYGTPNPTREYDERSILIHEVGHALGLVNHGIPMIVDRLHNDGRHSNRPESVMWPGLRGPSFLEIVQDNTWTPYRFDEYDLQDLQTFREAGRARSTRH